MLVLVVSWRLGVPDCRQAGLWQNSGQPKMRIITPIKMPIKKYPFFRMFSSLNKTAPMANETTTLTLLKAEIMDIIASGSVRA